MLFVGDVDGRRELRKNARRILRVVAVPRMSTAALAGSSEERRVWGAVGWVWFGLSESWRVGMVVCVLYGVVLQVSLPLRAMKMISCLFSDCNSLI